MASILSLQNFPFSLERHVHQYNKLPLHFVFGSDLLALLYKIILIIRMQHVAPFSISSCRGMAVALMNCPVWVRAGILNFARMPAIASLLYTKKTM